MSLMERRRALMAVGESTIDTTPKIMQYDVKWSQKSLVSASGYCVTERYFPNPNPALTFVPGRTYITVAWGSNGDTPTMVLYSANGTSPIDYWRENNTQWNRNAVSVSFTLVSNNLSNCYAYMKETGEVLFAGENTAYYGKRNIND